MNTQRFFGTTSRQAMARVKQALGEDAIILRNKPVNNGIEILAMSESEWLARTPEKAMQAQSSQARPAPEQLGPVVLAANESGKAGFVVAQSGQPAQTPPTMSTLSFEKFANDRRKEDQTVVHQTPLPLAPAPSENAPSGAASVHTDPVPSGLRLEGFGEAATRESSQRLVDEMRQMRSYISQQFSALSWVDGVRRSPGQSALLRRLLESGFSPRLSRLLVSRLPSDYGRDEAMIWLHSALARNLRCEGGSKSVLADGGVFALVGPTGVGKTTSTAKIAAHFALRHGVQSVGLITIDAYRIAAQDQLRAFGEMIGVPVLTAHDSESLAAHLKTLVERRLVLVDTAGVSQRDARVASTLTALEENGVQRVLVLSAAAQEGTLEEVIDAYRGRDGLGVILSKVDESPRLGGVIDALIRHRLRILGLADGQRVPEDWHEPDAAELVADALEPRMHDDFELDDVELTMLMQRIDGGGEPWPLEHVHE